MKRFGLDLSRTHLTVFKDKHGRYKTRQPLTMDELQSIRNIELNDRQLQKVRDQLYFNAIPAYHGLTYTCLIMTDVL